MRPEKSIALVAEGNPSELLGEIIAFVAASAKERSAAANITREELLSHLEGALSASRCLAKDHAALLRHIGCAQAAMMRLSCERAAVGDEDE